MASRARRRPEPSAVAPLPRGMRRNDSSTLSRAGAEHAPAAPPQPGQGLRRSQRLQNLALQQSSDPPGKKIVEPKKKTSKPPKKTPQKQRKEPTLRVQKRTPQPPIRKSYGPIQTSLKLGDFPVEKTENRAFTYFSRIRQWVLNCRWSAAEFGPIGAMAPFQQRRVGSTVQGGTTMGESGTKKSSASKIGSRDRDFADALETHHPTIQCYQKHYFGVEGRGPSKASQTFTQRLIQMRQSPLPDHRYDGDDVFTSTLERLEGKSERKVQHSLHDLICPQAEALADRTTDRDLRQKYDLLVDAMDEPWSKRAAIFKEDKSQGYEALAMPRPDYCVGFKATKFSSDQRRKLVRALGDPAIWTPMGRVSLPFLTCEAKYMNGLEQADNQNAHSMTLAIMSVVNLFRRAQCERTIHLEILGFSISYNHKAVQLYCHYPA
ncbi:hypothetical protein SLS57_012101 [Botryosphaeria dothidea]